MDGRLGTEDRHAAGDFAQREYVERPNVPLTTFAGDVLTRAWAERSAEWEPLSEVIQMKGQSESHPSLSFSDEFANYELWTICFTSLRCCFWSRAGAAS